VAGDYPCPNGPRGVTFRITQVASSILECRTNPIKAARSDLTSQIRANPNEKNFGPGGNLYCRVNIRYDCFPNKRADMVDDTWGNDITQANRHSAKMKLKRNLAAEAS